MSGYVDNRITLPLDHVQRSAQVLCDSTCLFPNGRPVQHDPVCLVPLLDQRAALLAKDFTVNGLISTDCRDGKCAPMACVGCACACHEKQA